MQIGGLWLDIPRQPIPIDGLTQYQLSSQAFIKPIMFGAVAFF